MSTVSSMVFVSDLCVSKPRFGQFWVIDYRIYAPDGDGKSKLEHLEEMLSHRVYHKQLPFRYHFCVSPE